MWQLLKWDTPHLLVQVLEGWLREPECLQASEWLMCASVKSSVWCSLDDLMRHMWVICYLQYPSTAKNCNQKDELRAETVDRRLSLWCSYSHSQVWTVYHIAPCLQVACPSQHPIVICKRPQEAALGIREISLLSTMSALRGWGWGVTTHTYPPPPLPSMWWFLDLVSKQKANSWKVCV